jgi:hypothetical protein
VNETWNPLDKFCRLWLGAGHGKTIFVWPEKIPPYKNKGGRFNLAPALAIHPEFLLKGVVGD